MTPLETYGFMIALAGHSRLHRTWNVIKLERLFWPPVSLGQIFIGTDRAHPWFATWALLSEDAETRWLAGRKLQPGDWQSGERVWIVDAICPMGGVRDMVRHIRRELTAKADAEDWTADRACWTRLADDLRTTRKRGHVTRADEPSLHSAS